MTEKRNKKCLSCLQQNSVTSRLIVFASKIKLSRMVLKLGIERTIKYRRDSILTNEMKERKDGMLEN